MTAPYVTDTHQTVLVSAIRPGDHLTVETPFGEWWYAGQVTSVEPFGHRSVRIGLGDDMFWAGPADGLVRIPRPAVWS